MEPVLIKVFICELFTYFGIDKLHEGNAFQFVINFDARIYEIKKCLIGAASRKHVRVMHTP